MFQAVDGRQAEQEQGGQQPVIHALGGRAIVAVDAGLHIDLQTDSSSITLLEDTLGTIPEDEVHGACLLDLQAHLHLVLVVILLIEDNHVEGFLLVSLLELEGSQLARIAFISGLCLPELVGQCGEDEAVNGAYFVVGCH